MYNKAMKKRRLQTIEARLNAYLDKTGECWLWTKNTYNYGYGKLSIGRSKQVRAHRYMYEKYKGEIPQGMNVLHTCDNPRCCNPKHLFLGNQKANMSDAKEKGRIGYRTFYGENHANSKITMEIANKIRELYKSGNYYQRELGEIFGVSQPVVSRIILNIGWLKNGEESVKINK